MIIPGISFASATVTSVTLNGSTPNGVSPAVQVQPGDNIIVSVTAQLTDKTKWKGTDWGINNFGMTSTCTNTKNAKEGTRDNSTGVFTEIFIAKAPKAAGLYNFNVMPDQANNCGQPLTGMYTFTHAVLVGSTTPPVIAAHSDITVTSTDGTGATVIYTNPTALDAFGNPIAVSCAPASGSYFLIGSTLVACTAQDAWGSQADPAFFNVQVLPPPDVTPPVITPHDDVVLILPTSTDTSGVVTYTMPTATDNVDLTDPVSCTPASGSTFGLGTTTVTCTAQDAASNQAVPVSFGVGVYAPAPPGGDTTPPSIAPHADVSVVATSTDSTYMEVAYDTPTATDNVDPTVAVSCTPLSGSNFPLGTTPVTCTAQDVAGNIATRVFNVMVHGLLVVASQPDESFLCDLWDFCPTVDNPLLSFTTDFGPTAIINLGSGAGLQGGLKSITISTATSTDPSASDPWRLNLFCFSDPAYSVSCTDWVESNEHNSHQNNFVFEDVTTSVDVDSMHRHWTADFIGPADNSNFDGSSPVVFNPSYYYQLVIDDNGFDGAVWGSQSLSEAYFSITGITP